MERPLIIGAGLAGLSAALTCARAGRPCVLVSAQASQRAQSVMAEGGINAALDLMGEDDSPSQHAADTLRGGVNLADPVAVRALCDGAPDVVRDLIALGVPFNTEGGRMVQRYFGGQKKARTAYAKSSTGKILVSALIDAVRRYEAEGLVQRYQHHELADLITLSANEDAPGRVPSGSQDAQARAHAVTGAVIQDAYSGERQQLDGTVILCTGGWAGLFGQVTTGTTTNVGDATAIAYACGAELANLEFVQYHPTTVPIANKRMLVSEAARGEGGRLMVMRDGKPWYFMEEKYPELGNLMPRDVVSREEAAVLADPACGNTVYLDLTGLNRDVWAHRLPDLREECQHYLGIDPASEPLPVEPGIHYCMGGIWVDVDHRTSVPGLYAAGECAAQYHGANRLGGNSLLGALFGGKVAAATAMAEQAAHPSVGEGDQAPCAGDSANARRAQDEGCPVRPSTPAPAAELSDVLNDALDILRDEESLARAEEKLAHLLKGASSDCEARRIQLARAAVACARARKESRGAHWRSDYPKTSDEFARTTVVRINDGDPAVEFRALSYAQEDAQ